MSANWNPSQPPQPTVSREHQAWLDQRAGKCVVCHYDLDHCQCRDDSDYRNQGDR